MTTEKPTPLQAREFLFMRAFFSRWVPDYTPEVLRVDNPQQILDELESEGVCKDLQVTDPEWVERAFEAQCSSPESQAQLRLLKVTWNRVKQLMGRAMSEPSDGVD